MVPGSAEAMVGEARRSMTPVGKCHSRSMTRGSAMPGGIRTAFFSSVSSRGPTPVKPRAEPNRGAS